MGALIDYTGKQVVVTGGSSGVGAALVSLLGDLGATVTVVDRNDPPADLSGVSGFIKGDLAEKAGVDAIIEQCPATVDVLVNNAGVAATLPNRVVIAVNYLSLRRLSEQLLDRIPKGGAIVNTASMAGLVAGTRGPAGGPHAGRRQGRLHADRTARGHRGHLLADLASPARGAAGA